MPVHRRTVLRAVALGLIAVLASACGSRQDPPGPPSIQTMATAAPSVAHDGTVDLRVYLRTSGGDGPHLRAVMRRVAIADRLPRRALELLIAGPVAEDGADVRRTLPATTEIRHFAVTGDTAAVQLSKHVVSDAGALVASPQNELLALAALANTLTEFPAIERVRLTVAGGDTAFWGGWGLPEVLNRDERVIGPPKEGDELPSLASFTLDPQRVGSADAAPVTVRSIRTADRIGFLRVVVELADASDELPASGVPPAAARIEDGRLVLQLDSVLDHTADLGLGQRLTLDHLPFDSLEAEQTELPGSVRLAVVPGEGHGFWLHTLTGPTRVVLDVRK